MLATDRVTAIAVLVAMKRRLLSSVAMVSLAVAPAFAADLPTKAPIVKAPDRPALADPWSGFYVGLNAGGAWASSKANASSSCATALPYLCSGAPGGAANLAAVLAAGSGTATASGFIGGVQTGYNWHSNNLVYGLETDIESFHIRASRSGSAPYPAPGAITGVVPAGTTFTIGSTTKTDWLYTLRGRAGWANGNFLAYVTGGLALSTIGVTNTFTDTFGGMEAASGSATKAGWTVGAGFEWAINTHWTAKAEYLYVQFPSVSATGIISSSNAGGAAYTQAISMSADLTAHLARAGVNYKF